MSADFIATDDGLVICDRVLGAMADRLCTCFLLPSYSQPFLDPYGHDTDCMYRRQVLGTALLTVGDRESSPTNYPMNQGHNDL